MWWLVVNPMRSNQNLCVFWKPVNPQDCVWTNLYRMIMRTISQEKGTNHCSMKIWYTNLFLCSKALKIPAAKAAVDNCWEKLEKFSAWNLTKVRSEKEVINEARTKGRKVHFASLMDTCHLKMLIWRQNTQKYKGRVVLRGYFVKDDSGSSAVFTEQGSSASQITAAASNGCHCKISWMWWTSSWCSICLDPGQNGRCSKIIENSQIGMRRHLDSSTTTLMA